MEWFAVGSEDSSKRCKHVIPKRYLDYIALSNSEEVASRITMQIVSSVQQLAVYPMSGRADRVPGTRELGISSTPFIIAYAIEETDIVVLAVYHGAQHWPEDF